MLDGVTRESIKPLLTLQRIDSASDRLTARRGNLPEQKELDELTASRGDLQAAVDAQREVLEEAARAQARLEAEVEQIDERTTGERARLYSGEVNNPRELSNIQAELDALARRKSHLEDQDLEVMEQREEAEKELARLQGELDALDASIADATARRDAATVEIDAELRALGEERAEVAPGLDADLVAFYEELRAKHGGVGVAVYEDGTCRGCGLPLSPVARDEYKRSDDPFFRCENCRRVLIAP